MQRVVAKKYTRNGRVGITISNYSEKPVNLTIYNISADNASDADIKPDFTDAVGDEYNKVWKCAIEPGDTWNVAYSGRGGGSLEVRGIEDKMKMVVDLDVE